MQKLSKHLEVSVAEAVAHYWGTRLAQREKQMSRGVTDAGLRSAVTGGAQMDGFIDLFKKLIMEASIAEEFIFRKSSLELPGYFRPTKEWDLVVVKGGHLIVAIEAKSQVGPSFGNNFNNRTEEAIGSALDLWTAFREGAFNAGMQPFLGYFFMLEECPGSNRPVRVKEPHFKVFPEFVDASYKKRYELVCSMEKGRCRYRETRASLIDSLIFEGTYRAQENMATICEMALRVKEGKIPSHRRSASTKLQARCAEKSEAGGVM